MVPDGVGIFPFQKLSSKLGGFVDECSMGIRVSVGGRVIGYIGWG